MPEKMRAILENGTSPIIKEFSSWRSFSKQDTLRTSISVNYLPRQKLSGYKELFNIINNEVSEEFKKIGLDVFSYSANLHKINLEKGLLKQEELTLETKNRKSVSMGLKPAVQSTCKLN
jgi:hypothetical protein